MHTQTDEALSATADRRDVIARLQSFAPAMVDIIAECCLKQVYDRPLLPEHTKEVVAVVALISLGSERLQGHFESALQAGMTVEHLQEVVLLSAIYLGFPRAIDAMLVLEEVAAQAG